jgi:hypothetical protein
MENNNNTTALTALFGCMGRLEDRKNNHFQQNLTKVRKYVEALERGDIELPDFSPDLPERPSVFNPYFEGFLDDVGIALEDLQFSFHIGLWELSSDSQVDRIADFLRSFDEFVDENQNAIMRFEDDRKLVDLEIISIRWDSGDYPALKKQREADREYHQSLEIANDIAYEMRRELLA